MKLDREEMLFVLTLLTYFENFHLKFYIRALLSLCLLKAMYATAIDKLTTIFGFRRDLISLQIYQHGFLTFLERDF